jgi:hypothetical protein
LNKVEPSVVNRCFNLLTKDNVRATLADEFKPDGPEMAFVGNTIACAGGTKRLAWARACPNRSVCGPAGKTKGAAPTAKSGKKMALNKSGKIACFNIRNAP